MGMTIGDTREDHAQCALNIGPSGARADERAQWARERGKGRVKRQAKKTHLELGIGPPGDLDNHVQDGLLLVGVEGDIVEGRDGDAILLDVDAVLERVGGGHLAEVVRGGHGGRGRRGGRRGRVQLAGGRGRRKVTGDLGRPL